jgi:hypothetical protein
VEGQRVDEHKNVEKQFHFTLELRAVVAVVVGVTVEAALWTQMENVPRGIINTHILVGLLFLSSLYVRSRVKWFRIAQTVSGLAYIVTILYILAYSNELWNNLVLTGPRYSWLMCFAVAGICFSVGVTTGFLIGRRGKSLSDSKESKLAIDAPRLQIDYSTSGDEHLIFTSDKVTFIDKIGPLVSRERYESKCDFNVSEPLSRIDPGAPTLCKVRGLQHQGSPDTFPLLPLLRRGKSAPHSIDVAIVDYNDDHGGKFSRRFELTRSKEDKIVWIPEPVVYRRGGAEIPEPELQSLLDLRHQLSLAARFREEQQAAQQFGQQLEKGLCARIRLSD